MTDAGQQKPNRPLLQWAGVGLALFSVAVTIALGVIATENDSLPVVFALLAATTQFGSAWLFSRHRKPDPSHAKTIVRNMATLSERLSSLVKAIETVQEKNPAATPTEIRQVLTRVNVEVTALADDAAVLIESWRDFDSKTVSDLSIEVRSNEINPDNSNSSTGGGTT
ncbi:hypothetical protein ACQ7HM_21260 [Williamsia sp. MIQD14]|uniref:hypothetical protein n=1 Tax=Williamsia sp. MIQD14 TaxID=3425703 RepID=UPI003DA05EB8